MAIKGFTGDYAFLSNFYPSPIMFNGLIFPTAEHFYQAQKTLDFEEAKKIIEAKTPGEAKRLGQNVTLRENWETSKEYYMSGTIGLKFGQNINLLVKLLDTGEHYLEETNTWGDKYWGVCDGEGENKLGELLMSFRDFMNEKLHDSVKETIKKQFGGV